MISTSTPDVANEVPPGRIADLVNRWHFGLLGLIIVVGAFGRLHGLSSGSLYTDDAWVAITNHEPLGTAVHMLVTAPGFTLFERFWTGLAPQTTWFAQLPNVLTSLVGIWAIYALARFWRYEAWVALTCATILSISMESSSFATHLKPYPDDLVAAAALLWLGERARRDLTTTNLLVLAIASVGICAWSFTNAVTVCAVFCVLLIASVRRREARGPVLATTGAAGLAILGLYVGVIRPQVTPALSDYWRLSYIDTSSLHAFAHSTRTSIENLIGVELGRTSSHQGLHLAGKLYEWVLLGLVALGALVSWRKNAVPVVALALAFVLAVAHKIPFGSNRTDADLFPGLLLLIAAAMAWLAAAIRDRAPRGVATMLAGGLAGALALGGVISLVTPPAYIGGDLSSVMTQVNAALSRTDTVVLVEPGTRFVWAYQEDPTASIIFGPSFNTGYSFVSHRPNVVIVPQTPQEPGFTLAPSIAKLAHASHVLTVGYMTPSFPLDQRLTHAALSAACWTKTSVATRGRFQVATYDRAGPECTPQ